MFEAFQTSSIPNFLNQTLLVLIPKCHGLESISHFRPISLCNTSYKIISKLIVQRLRPFLDQIISPLQSAFILGRRGMNNMIFVQELIHTLSSKKGKSGFMAIKIDLEKAYDRLNWNFIRGMLNLYKFPPHLIKLILSCVLTTSIFMLFNGGMLDPFLPSRGIRQRDPLSPFIFILCMEMLNFFIDDKCSNNLWDPLKVACGGPAFSHLCYADDLVLFAKVDLKNSKSIKEVLESFCDLSSLKVNLSKSKILFSPNVSQLSGDSICETIGF